MSANGTAAVAQSSAVDADGTKPPVLRVNDHSYQCRDLSDLSWAEQIKANKLMNRLGELQELLDDYFSIDDDDDEDEVEPPEEMQDQWRKVHQRIVRFGFPEVPSETVRQMKPSEVALASGRFTRYMQTYGRHILEDPEGNDGDSGTGNRKSRRRSQKRARSSATSTE